MSILKFKNIFYVKDNTTILNKISIDIHEGDCISIVGSSGSGKSTMLKICSDLISPIDGEILYRGKDYKKYDPIELRKKISYCVQIPYLFGKTVYDNVSYPFKIRKKDVDEKKIINFMEKFNLDISYLNKDINSLSGGEQQRIALIRNLIFKPDILLLDEATSALDKENAKVVENHIKEMNRDGVTVIWITHNIEQSESIFNKRVTLEQGQIKNEEELNIGDNITNNSI